jgi:hypothetical protein
MNWRELGLATRSRSDILLRCYRPERCFHTSDHHSASAPVGPPPGKPQWTDLNLRQSTETAIENSSPVNIVTICIF